MLKKLVCCAFIVLSLNWLAGEDHLKAGALTINTFLAGNVSPSDTHQTQPSTASTSSPLMTATGAFFALSVADINASAKWYSEKLGLKVAMQAPKQDKAAVIVLEGGGLIVELIQHDDALPLSKAAPAVKGNLLIQGIFKAGVIVEDFDKTVAMLKERKVEIAFGPFPAKANQRANVIIRDNAGNFIQFFGK
jgi:catechol 2,3-dioxygenase-like lactoylglutathione lyase family enzyme